MQKIIIYLTLLIEVLGISIIIPALPELKTYYGIGNLEVTLGMTVYSLFAFLTAPILGQLSDRYGRKSTLGACITGTALSYFVLLIQPQYRIFLLSRTINGITGGNRSIINAIITDISPDSKTKDKNFGLLGATFGIGFIVGPVLGSVFMSRGGVETIFRGGGILALLQSILLRAIFQNTNTPTPEKHITFNPLKTIQKFIIRPQLRPRLLSMSIIGVGVFIINSSQSLYMSETYGTSGITYGYYLAGLGIIGAINMALLVPRVRTRFLSTRQILTIVYTSLIVGYLIIGYMPTEMRYMGVFFLMSILSGPYQIIYNRHTMSQAQPHEIGELSGAMSSLTSIGMIIAPVIGGILLHYHINIHRGSLICIIIAAIIMRKSLTSHG